MELKYDKQIKELEDTISNIDKYLGSIDSDENLSEEEKNGATTVLNNRKSKFRQEINDLKELQKPTNVSLVI